MWLTGMNHKSISPLAIIFLLTASGCAGMSPADNARFKAVVAKNASVGMPFVTVIEHLVRAGFSCDDRVSSGRYVYA